MKFSLSIASIATLAILASGIDGYTVEVELEPEIQAELEPEVEAEAEAEYLPSICGPHCWFNDWKTRDTHCGASAKKYHYNNEMGTCYCCPVE